MNNKVVQLHAVEGGFDFDALFESLKGHSFAQVLVVTDELEWFGNINDEEAMMLMERLRLKLAKERDE